MSNNNRPWKKRGFSIQKETFVVGGYCELFGKPYIVSDTGVFDEVQPDTITCELGINDMDGIPLFENDYIEDVYTHEVYCLRYNSKFPFSAIHPFAFRTSDDSHCLEKFRLIHTSM